MAKPPGSCPHASHPWNCPAVKALQDAVDASLDAFNRIEGLEYEFMNSHPPRMFKEMFDLARTKASACKVIIADNEVEAR